MARTSRTLKIKLIHKLKQTQKTKNKYKTLQVIEIMISDEKLKRTIR